MNTLTVMFVDDEVLAIEHLKRMVDWEKEGFRVVGESARPLQALSLVSRLKPDLIFADIRMPHLDGIEFSKRVFASGHRCRIVLLTAYKEFEYVKEAISLGVTEYLIKHDLEPDTLRRELVKVKAAIHEERKNNAVFIRQYLKELTSGNRPSEELSATVSRQEIVKGREFAYVILSIDDYFAVLPGTNRESEDIRNAELPQLPMHDVEIAYLRDGRIGYLLSAKPVASRREAVGRCAEAASALCRAIEASCTKQRVVAAYSAPFYKLEDLMGIHRATMEQLTAGMLFDGAAVIGPASARRLTLTEDHAALLREALDKLQEGDPDSVEASLNVCFEKAAQTRSISYLADICEALTSALEALRYKRGLPSLSELLNEEATARWRTLKGIQAWLITKMEETLSSGTSHGYSRKVRSAIDYIAAHFAEDLSADSISMNLGISGEHLRHLFKQETGQTLHDYITKYRIEKAKTWLASGHYKLYEISDRVGYKSSHYFSKVFCKAVGMSPLDYAETKGAKQ
ncbi:response regulator transcription factor [Paenibacillus soyae]|uniref:Response regulator n=1 Tax=Paenibacillus soyae TaxID=2969249 RepID=A0A9X2SC24_9BACL|nr:response regulator [Paenibacillus soyae]MCR2806273.1 response regulator [Paenibacillus soyae]